MNRVSITRSINIMFIFVYNLFINDLHKITQFQNDY